jgi:hypothetical protein
MRGGATIAYLDADGLAAFSQTAGLLRPEQCGIILVKFIDKHQNMMYNSTTCFPARKKYIL